MRARAVGAALLLLLALVAGCGAVKEESGASQQPQGAALRIRIGTQDFPEAKILGELWRQALAVNGYTVDLRKGVGPAADLDQLLATGAIDGYVAYTGTVLSIVAGQEVSGLDPQQTYANVRTFYDGRGMAMSAMTPFQNKDAIATTKAFAQSAQLRSIADLAKLPSFRLGARPEFQNLYLGLLGLQQRYGLTNAQFTPIPVQSQYAALDAGQADAVDAFTTDAQLQAGDYQLLEDPQLLFGSQNAVLTVSKKKLAGIGQEKFLRVVDSVQQLLTEDAMVGMNAAVASGRSEEDVATGFLRDAGLMQAIR